MSLIKDLWQIVADYLSGFEGRKLEYVTGIELRDGSVKTPMLKYSGDGSGIFEIAVPSVKLNKKTTALKVDFVSGDVGNFAYKYFSDIFTTFTDGKDLYSKFYADEFDILPIGRFFIGSDWQYMDPSTEEQKIPMMLVEASTEYRSLNADYIPAHVRTIIVNMRIHHMSDLYTIRLPETVEHLIVHQKGTVSRKINVFCKTTSNIRKVTYFNAHTSILYLGDSVEANLEELHIVGDHCCGINGYNLGISHLKITSFTTTLCPACIFRLPESLTELRLVINRQDCINGFAKMLERNRLPNLSVIEIRLKTNKHKPKLIEMLKKLPKVEMILFTGS